MFTIYLLVWCELAYTLDIFSINRKLINLIQQSARDASMHKYISNEYGKKVAGNFV